MTLEEYVRSVRCGTRAWKDGPNMHCLPRALMNCAELPCCLGLASFLIALLLLSGLHRHPSVCSVPLVLCSDYCLLLFPITRNMLSTAHINDRFSHTLRTVNAVGQDWLCRARGVGWGGLKSILSRGSTQYEP